MLSDRRHWERACAEPDSITAMFEETVRADAPQRGVLRHTTAHLARTEGHVALAALTRRLPELRLVRDVIATYQPQFFLRGLRRLDVVWDV
jgi:cytochrome P450